MTPPALATASEYRVESNEPPATPPCRTAAGAISTPPPGASLSSAGTEGPHDYLCPPRRRQTGSRRQTGEAVIASRPACPEKPARPPGGEPLAVDAAGLGRLLDLDRSTVWKLNSSGRLPAPVYLSAKAPRWNLSELRRWLDAGAPDRRTWERLKRDQAGKGAAQ
ncbi:MAG TPA: hypothetical protein PKL76_21195 [Phycisphaerae bacterium]|nr:hypothetical protein [Phycisphaerae bacterium]